MNALTDKLTSIVGPEQIRINEPMSLHTTFHTGGPADYFVMPRTPAQLSGLLAFSREWDIPCYLIGNGSNLLVSDRGYRGIIIQLFQNYSDIRVHDHRITAQAGALLSRIAAAALDASLSGFAFAAGIPGTLGGACVMNAGAYGGEMKDVLESVSLMEEDGRVSTLSAKDLGLGYRTSKIARNRQILLEATIALTPGNADEIRSVMADLAKRRREKQPLEYGSAGSTFKRPPGYFAGKLIQDCGLRGYSMGGASVSEKHCGFIINQDHASSDDIYRLIRHVQETVLRQFQVALEPEVKLLGEF